MKGFLEEYGLIIVVVSVIAIMLLLGTEVGKQIQEAIKGTITSMLNKANDAMGKVSLEG